MTAPFLTRIGLLMFLAALFGATPGTAHEGHDHGAPPPPVSVTIAPRADASSADFELVAIARSAKLRIYLDTFRGNEPVEGAEIEVDGPGGTVKATATPDGAYALDAPWLARPGRSPWPVWQPPRLGLPCGAVVRWARTRRRRSG